MQKIKRFLFCPRIRFGYLSRLGLLNYMNDKEYLEKEYYLTFNKKPDTNNPKTFNEKLLWLKLNDHQEIYSTLVDKYEVKRYVGQIIGEKYIIPTIGIYKSTSEIDFTTLPEQFVMKCTHDSGGLVICRNKKELKIKTAIKTINRYLKRKYYYIHREWPYKNVEPRIIIEKYMQDNDKEELTDYKVMCFGGRAKIIFTCTERFSGNLKVTFFDTDWNKMPFERHYPSSNKKLERPKNLKQMLSLSEKLAQDIPFVRIDWYEINGKLYFGEYTFYPGAGLEEFSPDEWDGKIGQMIDINTIKKNEK